VPRGWLSLDDAGLVTRALALQHAPQVPDSLVEGLLREVQGFLAQPPVGANSFATGAGAGRG
jgi:hypothetical protein